MAYLSVFDFYGTNAYHMHLDNKLGKRCIKDSTQKRRTRILFSVIDEHVPGPESTVYLLRQPKEGFLTQKAFHAYMRTRYEASTKSSRPIYQIPDEDIMRMAPGVVAVHTSHPGLPIHSEPNPCPKGRCAFILDYKNIGKIPIPIEDIVDSMRVLSDPSTTEYRQRYDKARHALELLSSCSI